MIYTFNVQVGKCSNSSNFTGVLATIPVSRVLNLECKSSFVLVHCAFDACIILQRLF